MPNEIKVGGMIYSVVEKEAVIIDDDRNHAGKCNYTECQIELLSSLNPLRKEQTFFHELTHAILYEAGYMYDEHDEDLVDRFAIVAHQVFKDNWSNDVAVDVTMTYGGEEVSRKVHVTGSRL
ncbi:hypothetical protein EP56_07595 [Listeriaceae bacterium FSL A5-0209]|nr:hypothetical protein EP56_07595 [Listeriaceae bacterium FSL A5-0209]